MSDCEGEPAGVGLIEVGDTVTVYFDPAAGNYITGTVSHVPTMGRVNDFWIVTDGSSNVHILKDFVRVTK